MARDIVGRDAELASIGAFLERVREGPIVLLIEGPSGMGKTTLWLAAVEAARERGYTVLSSRPAEAEVGLSYAALGDLLGSHLQEGLKALPTPQRRALEAALLLSEPDVQPPDRRTVLVSVLGMLRAMAGSGPLVIGVDDVQWMDAPSAAAVEFAARRLGEEPIALLLAYRRDEEAPLPLSLHDAGLDNRLIRLPVRGLSPTDVNELVRGREGTALSKSVVEELHAATGGNPFFALETARAMVELRLPHRPGEPLPLAESLRDLPRKRMEGLPSTMREVLLTIAALPRPTMAQVETVHGAGAREVVAQAEASGLIEVADAAIRFAHPLLRSAVYSAADREARRKAHERLAAVSTDAEERARHLALAARGPHRHTAATVEEAAQSALGRSAPATAADLFEMALALTPAEDVDDARRRQRRAAKARFGAGDAPAARELLQEVVRIAPPGPERGEALYELGMVEATEIGWPVAVEPFTEGLPYAVGHPFLVRLLEQGLGYASLFMGDLAGSEAHAQKALEMAEHLGDPAALAESLSALAFVRFLLGGGYPSSMMERAMRVVEDVDPASLLIVLRPPFVQAQLLKYADRLEEARRGFRDLLESAADEGQEQAFPVLHYHLADLECRAGRWAAAARHAEESLRMAVLTNMPFYETMARHAVALVEAHRGATDAAREHAEAGLAIAEATRATLTAIPNLGVLGFLELSRGDPGRAHEYLGRAVELVSSMGVVEPGYFRVIPDAVEALLSLGHHDEAEGLLRPFTKRARALDRASARASAERCEAMLAAARGDLAGARRALGRALRDHDRVRQPFERARTLVVLGQVLRRDRQKRAARDAFEQAKAVFEDLGAPLWSAKVEDEAGRIGGRAPAPLGLTPTEERVAKLAAVGRTNREIAEALFMSVHTVEWNLSKVYRKLGIRSRTELAAHLPEDAKGS